MITIPARVQTREEWPDADFDFPEDEPIHHIAQTADRDDDFDDMDWDVEMDLGQTGGAKVKAVVDGLVSRPGITKQPSTIINIRPPIQIPDSGEDEDEEGISTIKVATISTLRAAKPTPPGIHEDDDIEDAFSLPHDMTQLSLRPLSLHHQSSKGSLEWGDKEPSSSQSSDTYSNLGLHDGSASSNYTSASQPETDTDEDEEDQLDGLVIPSGLFEKGSRKLNRILQLKKSQPVEGKPKVASPHPEDDFEIGLVIGDDVDFSPSRLLQNAQHPKRAPVSVRSKSMPANPSVSSLRPPSRIRGDRVKSPVNPPPSSIRQFRNLAANPPVRTQSYSEALAQPPTSSGTFLTAKTVGSLRGQKSHSGLNPSPTSNQRRLGRKASLPTLSDPNQPEASGSGSNAVPPQSRYEATTASSRAKSQTTSRAYGLEHLVPPTRPSTPSSNPAALRLTMPTSSSRLKARPPVSAVFPNRPPSRSNSPLISRPPSSTSIQQPKPPTPSPITSSIKVLKRPKRPKVYGDGTELDNFDDLPLDGDKETKFRVQPKLNRVPGASYPKPPDKETTNPKGTLRRKPTREPSSYNLRAESKSVTPVPPLPAGSLRRKGRIDSSMFKPLTMEEVPLKKKRVVSLSTTKKPHLIRNPGGASTPKVVGEMKWNPTALRWEGNDQALRDFDVIGTSTRPALITHLTGSSIGSPVGTFANGARIVGNMIFDPTRMCWISALPPDEDEPDVFAELADDEEDCGWETKAGTIRANQLASTAESVATSDVSDAGSSNRIEPPSPARGLRRRSSCESSSDRGSRASLVYDVDDNFLQTCRDAEARHKSELKGWKLKNNVVSDQPDRSYLWEIRALATRRY